MTFLSEAYVESLLSVLIVVLVLYSCTVLYSVNSSIQGFHYPSSDVFNLDDYPEVADPKTVPPLDAIKSNVGTKNQNHDASNTSVIDNSLPSLPSSTQQIRMKRFASTKVIHAGTYYVKLIYT
jgi:hypothetical protein